MSIQAITIKRSHLVLSQTPMQQERRRHRTAKDISELAESMKSVEQIHPIVVRPNPFPENITSMDGAPIFEIVAGEGRYLAAEAAGIDELRAEVRDLNDAQVEEIQLIENLQRTGLHELVEAEGYEALMKRGHTVDEVAIKTGKSKATVYTRVKLLALGVESRTAFRDGKISASVALLIARIPGDEQQLKALTHILHNHGQGEPMNYRSAAMYVQDTFMLQLSKAPFEVTDATLVPAAGACGPCPMRTGNNPDLFGDVRGADVCTNPECFKAKRVAHVQRELDAAKATGLPVLKGGKARTILPDRSHVWSTRPEHKQLRNGYVRPNDKCLDDPKKRTYAQLANYTSASALLQNPDTGAVEKVYALEDIAGTLTAKGIKLAPSPKDAEDNRKQGEEREAREEKAEMDARRTIFQRVLAAAPRKLGREDLAALLSTQYDIGYGSDEDFYSALGWEPPEKDAPTGRAEGRQVFLQRLLRESDAKLAQLAIVLPVIGELLTHWKEPEGLELLAARFGIDVDGIREATAQGGTPEPPITSKAERPARKKKPAKAKKKAARKKK